MKNKKKRILFLSYNFIYGGAEIVIADLMNSELLHQKYDIMYSYRYFDIYDKEARKKIETKWHNKLFPQILLSNVTLFYFHELEKKHEWYRRKLRELLLFAEKIGIYYIYNYCALFFLFKKQRPDILFINNGGYPGSELCRLSALVAKRCKINKVIFRVNNIAVKPETTKAIKEIDEINNVVNCFITASIAAKNALSKNAGFDINKIVTIPNTINTKILNIEPGKLKKEFNVGTNTIILGSAGFLTKRKGFDVLINAISDVLKQKSVPDFLVFIFGEGEERETLENLIKKLNLTNVFLPGNKEDIFSYMADLDIFILPSISYEDMPLVIIGAMMLKKPVIGTNVAGIPEEVDAGKTGFVVEPNNVTELSSAIIQLLNDKELCKTFSEQGFKRYNDLFYYDIIVKKYMNLFENLLKEN